MASKRWVDAFLALPRAKLLARIDDEFLHNSFNVTGIKLKVTNFTPAYELIRRNSILSARGEIPYEKISEEAEDVYGLLHARYLITKQGLEAMYHKFYHEEFMKCPRVNCRGAQCLPYGTSDELHRATVKMYCPCCSDIYNPIDPDILDVDGAYFGSSWVHMFLQRFPQVVPKIPMKIYVPRIFGFRICHSSDVDEEESAADED